jgi:hypothetical protein
LVPLAVEAEEYPCLHEHLNQGSKGPHILTFLNSKTNLIQKTVQQYFGD